MPGWLEWKNWNLTYIFDIICPSCCDLTSSKQDTLFSSSFVAVHKTTDEASWLAFSLL